MQISHLQVAAGPKVDRRSLVSAVPAAVLSIVSKRNNASYLDGSVSW